MPDKETVYKGELDDFDVVGLESPLVGARGEVCDYYCSAYGRDAGKAREDGDKQKADVFQFLGVLTSFHLNQGDPSKPYTPMLQMEGRRSLVPDDLADSDYIAVRRVAERVTDPALRARCFDVLWLKERNHQDCREAVASYLESAKHLDDDDRWVHAVSQYRRGIKLASKIGRQNKPFQEISTALCSAIEAKNDEEDGFRTCQLLAIASEVGCGIPEAWAKIAFEIGERAVKSGDFRRAREYWMLEEGFKRAAKDGDGADSAALRVAEAFVSEGMARVEGENASYMAAASFLKNGVEALRRARAPRDRIEEVRSKLAEFQELSLGEMKSYEYTHDISEMVQGARDHVKGTELLEALRRFAFGCPLTNVADLKDTVINNANEFPLQHLFGGSVVDDKGRSTAQLPTLLGLEGDEAEKAVEDEMFSNLSRYHWGIRVQGFIEPARVQILNEHHPELRDLAFLVQNNPFVPPAHEGVFLRGLHAGFHGDFLVAAHLLVPQIENSIRYALESNDVDVSNLMSDGTQPVKILGPLFDLQETTEIFGESLVFELRGLLIEKRGADFRNRIAHGLVSEAECYGAAPVILWWIVLRLCLIPVLREIAGKSADAESEQEIDKNQTNMSKELRSYFKYRPLWQWEAGVKKPHETTGKIFNQRELWYAVPNSFNDPFDCNLRLHARDSTDAEWEQYCDTMATEYPEQAEKMEMIKAGKIWQTNPELAESVGQSSHDTHYNKSSVLCLAKRGDSIPMFSYYADSHNGVALEFRFSHEQIPCGFDYSAENHRGTPYEGKLVFRDVEYSEEFPALNYHRIRGKDQLVRGLLFTKHKDWNHEQEYRIFRRGVAASPAVFDDQLLIRVIFGCKAGTDEETLVKEYLSDWKTPVALARAKQSPDGFGLIIEDFDSVGGS